MAKKRIVATITMTYDLEIETDDAIVKEFDNDNEMVEDCLMRGFGPGSPVVNSGGVKVINSETSEVTLRPKRML